MDASGHQGTGLRCLLLGPIGHHSVMGRVAAFVAAGCETFVVNVGPAGWTGRNYPIPRVQVVDSWIDPYYRDIASAFRKTYILERLRILGLFPEDRNLARRVRAVVEAVRPHFAVVHWGPIAIHYARILRRVVPELAVIDIPNLLPSHISLWNSPRRFLKWEKIEDSTYRHWLRRLTGIVYASQEMRDFATPEYRLEELPYCVLPDYLPASFALREEEQEKANRSGCDGDPRVIYLGAPERWGRLIDAVDELFMGLAEAHIHVYSATISDDVISTGFGHRYPPLPDEDVVGGELARLAANFDAALVTYNVSSREERFRSTYPTRFFTALSAGLPIALRAGLLDACERFVGDNEIGFVYTSPEGLRAKLLDRAQLAKYRANLLRQTGMMTAESQGRALRAFLERVLTRA